MESDEHESLDEEINSENEEKPSDNGDEEEEKIKGNPGWADAMARILGKKLPDEKPAVLIKYKKAEREKKRKREEHAKQKLSAQEKHNFQEKNHVKPNLINDESERSLRRVATKGVVKLFNAVNKHQKEIESKLKTAPTEAKKARVMKSVSKTSFLEMLKNNSNDATTLLNNETEKDDRISRWNILRDDFMMGGKMKDWDKDNLEYENEEDGEVIEDESD